MGVGDELAVIGAILLTEVPLDVGPHALHGLGVDCRVMWVHEVLAVVDGSMTVVLARDLVDLGV